jgi:hypothetical protein
MAYSKSQAAFWIYFYAPFYAVKFLQKRLTEGISEFVVISQKQIKFSTTRHC